MAKLSYPEPGVTQLTDCLLITDCLKIRVIDTSTHETLAFTLTLYPQFGDPVSADFSIFINQCTASTIAVTNPPDLVIARSASPSNAVQYFVDPDYNSLFVSSHPIDCPIIEFEL